MLFVGHFFYDNQVWRGIFVKEDKKQLQTGVYWIEILKDYFDKQNLEDFKRFCEIIMISLDFKRLFLMTFYNQDFEHVILMDL